jgi:hypothetical protein
MAVVEVADRDEEHRRVPVLAEDSRSVVEIVEVSVVEGDQHRLLGQRRVRDVVGQDGVEVDDRVAELPQLVHLLVEERDGHGQRIARDVVDLVVHQHAQAAVPVAVRADCDRRLADRPVDGVLQQLLEPVGAHGFLA